MRTVVLRAGRERSVRRRHPWVMSGAVARVDEGALAGELVAVVSEGGEVLGHGHYAPGSAIRVRLLELGKESRGEALLAERVAAAAAARAAWPGLEDTDGLRLVNAEGDGLPGLVVDRYADVLVVRPSTAGMMLRAAALAAVLREATGAASAWLRPDAAALRREGAAVEEGALFGAPPEAPVEIREAGRRYLVDTRHGQKTGFYLDQRDARARVQSLASGRRVLDLFCYTGGFALAAVAGGAASVTAVDASRDALDLAGRQPGLASGRVELLQGDAFRFLRGPGPAFDLVVLDPPPLARRRADVARASRAYKDLILHALRRLSPRGQLLAFACSHHVAPELFGKIAFGASLDAARPLRVLGTLGAPVDHPVSIDHPEGRYLTGLWLEASG